MITDAPVLDARIIRALDPGIRERVVRLDALGFRTTDSGDGVSKPKFPSVLPVPHVYMAVTKETLFTECGRLVQVVGEWVDEFGPCRVQALYAPEHPAYMLEAIWE